MELQRSLVVRKEHLDNIFDNGKVWEMRSSKTNIRGLVGLIESGSGLIMGTVEIIGCSDRPTPKCESLIAYHKVEDLDLLDKWKYAWFLVCAKRFDEPIPYDHPQGAVIWVKHYPVINHLNNAS